MPGPIGALVSSIVRSGAGAAGRYAMGVARSRGSRVIGGVMMAERTTRPIRAGALAERGYSRIIGGSPQAPQEPSRRRGASFEYIYKY
jgi:hypothetical protein